MIKNVLIFEESIFFCIRFSSESMRFSILDHFHDIAVRFGVTFTSRVVYRTSCNITGGIGVVRLASN